jgi:hypothetical protein
VFTIGRMLDKIEIVPRAALITVARTLARAAPNWDESEWRLIAIG